MTPDVTHLIERATGPRVARLLAELKELRAEGWDVTALLAPDGSVVGLGYCAMTRARVSQLSLLAQAPERVEAS